MIDKEIDKHYVKEADNLVKLLFDKRFLNDDLSLESTEWLKDYLAFVLQSKCEMAAKSAVLVAKLRDKRQS